MPVIEALNWRYAVKRMNGRSVPQEKIDRILEAIRLAPTSMGLQPFTVLSISDPEVRNRLKPVANHQPQVVESSHLLVFAAWRELTPEHIDRYIEQIARVREIPVDDLADFQRSLMNYQKMHPKEQHFEWASRQAYVALGTALTAAALERVDSTPMEGFQPEKVDEILGLREKNLGSVLMLALGYRDNENDFLAGARKVRRDREKLIVEIGESSEVEETSDVYG